VVSVTPLLCFTPGERTPGTHCKGGWVGPRAGLDTEDRGKILCPCRGSNPGRLVRIQTLCCLSYPAPKTHSVPVLYSEIILVQFTSMRISCIKFRRTATTVATTTTIVTTTTAYVSQWRRESVELIVAEVVKVFPVLYWPQRFITVFATARHLSLSWARWIQQMSSFSLSPSVATSGFILLLILVVTGSNVVRYQLYSLTIFVVFLSPG
jgi:hypothetical protein